MATTATITLASDISAAYSGYSKTMTLTKADTNNDIEETTGFSRRKLASTSAVDLIRMADASLLQETADAKAAKVFVQNVGDGKGNIDKSTYVTISIGDTGGTPQEIGRLYGGDWAMFPVTGADDKDVVATPSTDDAVVLEYVMFFEV
tara:strand:- start:465 stop:908 length:444 start_codon:yes stop_codon:yes gene_type:complete